MLELLQRLLLLLPLWHKSTLLRSGALIEEYEHTTTTIAIIPHLIYIYYHDSHTHCI